MTESRIFFDSQLLCQGINLNKFLVYLSILIFITLLPMHLDEISKLTDTKNLYLKGKSDEYVDRLCNNLVTDLVNLDLKTWEQENQALTLVEATSVPETNLDSVDGLLATAKVMTRREIDVLTQHKLKNWKKYLNYDNESQYKYYFGNLTKVSINYDQNQPISSVISINHVFLPLFIWQSIAILGAIVGIIKFYVDYYQSHKNSDTSKLRHKQKKKYNNFINQLINQPPPATVGSTASNCKIQAPDDQILNLNGRRLSDNSQTLTLKSKNADNFSNVAILSELLG